ncbi:MAG: hypothetical protein HC934_07170 [Acaryochloridaceae cyanobacterium SU_2_1]|nr:hypothetical protein [Acaryochloridaceae cyanobacterium SU_2_1]
MKRPYRLAYTVLASLTLLTAGVSQAQAGTITVTRGPNGAAHLVNMDNIPVDAKVQPSATLSPARRVVTRGPNGASHIASDSSPANLASSPTATLNPVRLKTRGPNGAAQLSN